MQEALGVAAAPTRLAQRLDDQLVRLEQGFVVLMLALAALPAALSFFLRQSGAGGTAWLDLVPRYATLGVAFVGASVATHHGSHIALDLLHKLVPPRAGEISKTISELASATVAALLAQATWQFIAAEREGGAKILDLVPSYVPALLILWGFGVTALRFAARALFRLPAIAGIGLVACGALVVAGHLHPEHALAILGPTLLVAIVTGAPIFVVLGGAALLFFHAAEVELAVVPIEIFRLTDAPTLVTLPLFTLLGGMLAKSHAPDRLVAVARACLGFIPGGLPIATVVICAFFTTFTGASGVTILALGLLLQRLLVREGYDEGVALGLITSSGSIGLLFAPALPLIVYGIVGKVDIEQLFAAGVAPGFLLIVAVAAMALFLSRRSARPRQRFELAAAKESLRAAAFDLLVPVLILGLILSGLATVVEAAALAVLYALAVALWLKRDLTLQELGAVAAESGVLIGTVLVILGVAVAFTGYLVDAEAPQQLVEWAKTHVGSRWVFLLAMNVLLLVVGCLLDIFSAIIIFVPLLAPVGAAFEVHPVHLAMIFLANLELGYLTPPVGMNLFLSAHRFGKPMPEIWRTVAPYLLVLGGALLAITYVPSLSLWALP